MEKTPLEIFDKLQQEFARPEGTEARLVSDLLEDHVSNSNTDGTVSEEDLAHFDTILEELLVATMLMRRRFNELRGHRGDQCPIPFTLKSSGDDGRVLEGRVEITPLGIEIGFKGYGTHEVDNGAPVFIEQQNGVARMLVWTDINSPDYTTRIGLGLAQEKFRRDGDTGTVSK